MPYTKEQIRAFLEHNSGIWPLNFLHAVYGRLGEELLDAWLDSHDEDVVEARLREVAEGMADDNGEEAAPAEGMRKERGESVRVVDEAASATDRHRWDRDGERCVKCRDKDWMGGPCNTSDDEHITNLTAERDAAIRERDAALSAAGITHGVFPELYELRAERERLRGRVAELERAYSAECDARAQAHRELSDLAAAVRERESGEECDHSYAAQCREAAAARDRADRMMPAPAANAGGEHEPVAWAELLGRLAEWDHMTTAADGPYWIGEIKKVLSGAAAPLEAAVTPKSVSLSNAEGLRTERVTLEVTHDINSRPVELATWVRSVVVGKINPGESVRVVEEPAEIALITAERDLARAVQAGLRSQRDAARARVAELEAAPAASGAAVGTCNTFCGERECERTDPTQCKRGEPQPARGGLTTEEREASTEAMKCMTKLRRERDEARAERDAAIRERDALKGSVEALEANRERIRDPSPRLARRVPELNDLLFQECERLGQIVSKYQETRQWDIEKIEDGCVRICFGDHHHRALDCEWEYFIPASREADLKNQRSGAILERDEARAECKMLLAERDEATGRCKMMLDRVAELEAERDAAKEECGRLRHLLKTKESECETHHPWVHPSAAPAGTAGGDDAVVVPQTVVAGNFAQIHWNTCCRLHRMAMDKAGVRWTQSTEPSRPESEEAGNAGGEQEPPRGWLTADERAAVEMFIRMGEEHDDVDAECRAASLRALLARSTPPMVRKVNCIFAEETRDWHAWKLAETKWIAAIRAAGGEVADE